MGHFLVQSDGMVNTDDAETVYVEEPLKKLMTGVIYNGDYAMMADNPDYPNNGAPDNAAEYFTTLENNEGRSNGHMKIDVTKGIGSTYTVAVCLDNEQDVCYSEELTLDQFTTLDLQSHWGSGVIFSNMNITKKES